jgi:hypothetical protein
VAQRVGQPLLDDPERIGIRASRQTLGAAVSGQLDGEAGGASALHQGRYPVETSFGVHPITVCVSKHVQHPVQLDERVAAGVGDRGEVPIGGRRVSGYDRLACLCLDGDQGDGVRDHVVQLSGDPPALGLHGLGSLVRAGDGRQAERHQVAVTTTHGQPEAERKPDEQQKGWQDVRVRVGGIGGHCHGARHADQDRAGDDVPRGCVGGQRVRRHDDREKDADLLR